MKITSSTAQLASRHASMTQHEVKESLRLWRGDRRADFEGRKPQVPLPSDTVELSQKAREICATSPAAPVEPDSELDDEPKIKLIVGMIEMLTGKKIRLFSPRELDKALAAARAPRGETAETLPAGAKQRPGLSERAGFGLEYDYSERHYEAEKTTFSAQGSIKTQDGQERAFSVEVSMSREFLREQNVSIRAGDAKLKDPLVLNFSGGGAELTARRFSFDIDSDGRSDQIAFVGANSGFLALDRNRDGAINDGRELFGPATGQGFAELAEYDADGNQWIDENDPIYQNLRIWSKDAEGRDQLLALGQRGVGAIYLGHISTPFSFKDSQNALLGQIQDSGIFMRENGAAGVMQQIDLSV